MDKHERGWEIREDRPDLPLPMWNGSYGGDKRRLPKVIQKLLHGRPLTPEEKAELLWRFHELEQRAAARRRATTVVVLIVGLVAALALVAADPPPWLRDRVASLFGPVAG